MYFIIAAAAAAVIVLAAARILGYGIYYDVPPCPKCGSPRTGRYLRRSMFDYENEQIRNEAVKDGELVELTSDPDKKNTAFCRDCQHEWTFTARTSLIKESDRTMQRNTRYTEDEIEEAMTTFGQRLHETRQRMKNKPFIERYMPFSDLTSEVIGKARKGQRGRRDTDIYEEEPEEELDEEVLTDREEVPQEEEDAQVPDGGPAEKEE